MNLEGMFTGITSIRGGGIPSGNLTVDNRTPIIDRISEDYYRRAFDMGEHFLSPATLWFETIDFKIKKVIFNNPATIVLWQDGTKTVVICQEGDTYSKELGLAMCISKKALGNKGNFNDIFKEWVYE
ncbi:MAG: hypothetical protein GX763_07020, partial [Clostridiaceae bacterium]|nr:hypothetical protein [Clostridiaceae bacterium]